MIGSRLRAWDVAVLFVMLAPTLGAAQVRPGPTVERSPALLTVDSWPTFSVESWPALTVDSFPAFAGPSGEPSAVGTDQAGRLPIDPFGLRTDLWEALLVGAVSGGVDEVISRCWRIRATGDDCSPEQAAVRAWFPVGLGMGLGLIEAWNGYEAPRTTVPGRR